MKERGGRENLSESVSVQPRTRFNRAMRYHEPWPTRNRAHSGSPTWRRRRRQRRRRRRRFWRSIRSRRTFVVDFRDVDDGSPPRDHRNGTPFVQTARILNPNILATPIWSNERSGGALEACERRFPPMDGDGNANGNDRSEDLRYVRMHLNVTALHIDENFIKLNDGETALLRDKINFAVSLFRATSFTFREQCGRDVCKL